MLAIDLFSGVGGMALGFERAGFTVCAAFDSDKKHTTTYSKNFPNTRVCTLRVQDITGELILNTIKPPQQIDLIFGGPPCQGFSVGGKKDHTDERNELIFEFARIVSELRPRAFVVENVKGILSPKYRNILKRFYEMLTKAGYTMPSQPYVLRAEEYGIPQSRSRVFFIGVLNPIKLPPHPKSVFPLLYPKSPAPNVRDALSDLPLLSDFVYLFDEDRYTGDLGENPSLYAQEMRKPRVNHRVDTSQDKNGIGGFLLTKHTKAVVERFAATPPGAREQVSRFHRLDYDSVAPTLRAGTTLQYGKFMAPRPIHPVEHRCITVREAARLHSFPDWFEFHATKWYGFMQVGNSVPPLMAEAVARTFESVL